MRSSCRRALTKIDIYARRRHTPNGSWQTRRHIWTERVPREQIQIYASTSNDPYLNLSIEQYLLQKSSPDSTVLFTYINRPCVVIGRNQNPWLEANLELLGRPFQNADSTRPGKDSYYIDLIRRRSGGGTVFHDEGNVNWSVICPPSAFTRDKHCEMVVRALRSCGIERARVNERHDIVLDQGQNSRHVSKDDTHQTPFTVSGSQEPRPLKVSGSAYKLTRTRSMHHATMLLSSPNLKIIPEILRSPAKDFINAKGVDSVSSPVGNIGLGQGPFLDALNEQFRALYRANSHTKSVLVGEEALTEPKIAALMEEMKTDDWLYAQTPHFTFDTHRINEENKLPVSKGTGLPPASRVFIETRQANILKCDISISSDHQLAASQKDTVSQKLQDGSLHKFGSWRRIFEGLELGAETGDVDRLVSFLDDRLPPTIRYLK